MKKKELSLIVVMLSLAGCGGGNGTGDVGAMAGAPAVTLADSAATTNASADSSQFLMQAYRDGLLEIQLSQLALQKTANADVRRFAQRMVDDHTRMNNEITQLAQRKNIALPTALSAEQQAQVNRLSALSGEEFDRAYMAGNVDLHRMDVAAARQQARQGNDADVRMLADASLPILRTHLAVAEEINGVLDPAAYLVGAYQDGLTEIQLSQLALQKTTNGDVRRFAQRMIDNHTQVNNRITTLAQQKGVNLPNALTSDRQAVLDEVARFSGADFDKTYMDQNVVVHVKGVRQAGRQSDQGRDPEVKGFAQLTLPVLTAHLATAIAIDSGIEPSFLYKAFQDGKAEVQLAHLALMQGSDAQVKAFAQQMITDHTPVNAQIMQLAQQRNLPLPAEASAEQSFAFVDLLGRSGGEFDREYMAVNIRSHSEDVEALTAQSQNSTDPEIKAFATNTLPVVTAHLTRAREIAQQLGGVQP